MQRQRLLLVPVLPRSGGRGWEPASSSFKKADANEREERKHERRGDKREKREKSVRVRRPSSTWLGERRKTETH